MYNKSWNDILAEFARFYDFNAVLDASGNYLYVGFAHPGSLNSAPAWQIFKLTYDPVYTTTPVKIRFANGSHEFVNVWDNYLTYTY